MKNATILNEFQEHPFKQEIANLRLRQYDVAHSLGIDQGRFSRMLNGIIPIGLDIVAKIQGILDFVREQKKVN